MSAPISRCSTHQDVLPDSRCKNGKGAILHDGHNWIPVFCANCGHPEGYVPEEHMTFAFVLCTPCYETWGERAHHYAEPSAVFYGRVLDAQFDKLTPIEVMAELKNERSPLSKLVRDYAKGRL